MTYRDSLIRHFTNSNDPTPIHCYVDDSTEQLAVADNFIVKIVMYSTLNDVFIAADGYSWNHAVPANTKGFSNMSINTNTDSSGKKSSVILKHFSYQHLPLHLRDISKLCHDLAVEMDQTLPSGPEKSSGLRKLLEAKDCFVRANLDN